MARQGYTNLAPSPERDRLFSEIAQSQGMSQGVHKHRVEMIDQALRAYALERKDPMSIKYGDVLQNEHFQKLARLIRVALQKREPKMLMLAEKFVRLTPATEPAWDKTEVLGAFTDMLACLGSCYDVDDMAWFVSVLDSQEHKAVIKLFQAYYTAPEA